MLLTGSHLSLPSLHVRHPSVLYVHLHGRTAEYPFTTLLRHGHGHVARVPFYLVWRGRAPRGRAGVAACRAGLALGLGSAV